MQPTVLYLTPRRENIPFYRKTGICPGAVHCDLYDQEAFIPWDKLQESYAKRLLAEQKETGGKQQ